MIQQIFSPELINAMGWTLVHTLWQAALFAVLLGFALLFLRKYSARSRYVTAIGVLGAFFLTTVLTFGQLYFNEATPAFTDNASITFIAPASAAPNSAASATERVGEARNNLPEITRAKPAMVTPTFRQRVVDYYNQHLPLIVTLWLMGVLILQLRFLGQLAFLQRLKNYGSERFPAKLAPMLQELESKLGITKPIRYLTSFRVNSPFTAGWLQPAVLFPRGLLGELSEAQLRTIIAHELAHIKRYDFLVNLVQTLLCILFFYHPAAWWISARIDEEREHCCDDMAIEATGEPVGYARTLLKLKEAEIATSPLAMGYLGKGDGFKDRITRLLSGYLGTGTYGEGFTTAVILFCFMGLAVTLSARDSSMDQPIKITEKQEIVEPGSITETVQDLVGKMKNATPKDMAELEASMTELKNSDSEDVANTTSYEYWKNQPGDLSAVSDSLEFPYLMEAIKEGSESMVSYFLEKDIDLTQTNRRGLTPLALAAAENRPEIISLLVDKGADVNHVTDRGWTALIEAADEGAFEAAKALLDAGAKPDVPGTSRSAADMAASEGHPEILELLSKNGAEMSGRGREGSPLHLAAEEGQFFVVQSLLQAGADAGAKDRDGRAALSFAAEEGHGAVVALLAGLCDPNAVDKRGRTALNYAAEEGHQEVVKMLQSFGAIDTGQDDEGLSPLHYAALEGMADIVNSLIKKGADLEATDEDGRTPLFYAVVEHNRTIVRDLIKAGANVKAKDRKGNSVMDYALDIMLEWLDDELEELGQGMTFNDETGYPRDATVEIVWKLQEAGATSDRIRPYKNWIEADNGRIAFPYILDKDAKVYRGNGGVRVGGDSPDWHRSPQPNPQPGNRQTTGKKEQRITNQLVEAVREDDIDDYTDLLEAGADINGSSRSGYSPLTMASQENHNIDTDRLLRLGADINKADNRGYTALTEAAKHGHFNVVRTLIENKADLDKEDGNGNTALEYALRDGSIKVVRLLNEGGATVTAIGRDGTSPLEVPAREGRVEIVRYLLEQGVDPDAANGCPPVFLAAREGHGDVVALLARNEAELENGCNYRDSDYFRRAVAGGGETMAIYENGSPLMVALTQVDIDVVTKLLRAGAEVENGCEKVRFNIPGNLDWTDRENLSYNDLKAKHELVYEATGWTPLMEATESGNIELVKLLLGAGANKQISTKEGKTAYDVALANGFEEIGGLVK